MRNKFIINGLIAVAMTLTSALGITSAKALSTENLLQSQKIDNNSIVVNINKYCGDMLEQLPKEIKDKVEAVLKSCQDNINCNLKECLPVITTTQPVATTTEVKTTQPVATTTEVKTTQPVATTTEVKTTQPVATTTEVKTTQPVATTTEVKTTQPVATTTEVKTTQPVATTTNKPSNNGNCDAYALEVLELVNIERASVGLAPLTLESKLCEAADIRAVEIVNNFSHTRPNGTSCFTAVNEVGYSNYRQLGENIAGGQTTPKAVVEAWMNSDGHRANILSSNFTKLGVGYNKTSQGYGHYWAQMFAG